MTGISLMMIGSSKVPVQFIGSAFNDASNTFYSQPVPSGETGDLLILISGANAAVDYSTPAGWTFLGKDSSASRRAAWFYKTASAASESNFNVTVTAAAPIGGVVLRFRYAAPTPSIGTISTGTAPTAITASAVSAGPGDLILQCFVAGGSNAIFSVPSVSNGTLFTDTNANQPSIAVFYQNSASSNATSTPTGTSVLNAVQIRLTAA